MATRPAQKGEPPRNFLVLISGWSFDYSWGQANPQERRRSPYAVTDYRHLKVRGQVLSPRKIAGRSVELTFAPWESLLKATEVSDTGIGTLYQERRSDCINSMILMPADALPLVVSALAAGAYRFVHLDTNGWIRGNACVFRAGFAQTEYRETYPDAPAEIEGLI